MGSWIKFEIILLAACVAVIGLVYWATAGYPDRVELARRTPAPEGYRYLDACDGRPTDRMSDISVEGLSECLLDYPGDFARSVALGFSVTMILFTHLIYLAVWMWRAGKGG